MSDKKKTLVLFDVGGVMIELTYSNFYKAVADITGREEKEVKKSYISFGLEKRSLMGGLNSDETLKEMRKWLSAGKNLGDDKLKIIQKKCWGNPIKEMIDLKERVCKKGYSVGIFSNMNSLGLELISQIDPKIFEVYDKSSPKIFSFEVGNFKPFPQMYKRIEGYEKVVFIDDKEAYIKRRIESFGWKGIVFTKFIDKEEPIRYLPGHVDKIILGTNVRFAKSIDETVDALKYFGLEI